MIFNPAHPTQLTSFYAFLLSSIAAHCRFLYRYLGLGIQRSNGNGKESRKESYPKIRIEKFARFRAMI